MNFYLTVLGDIQLSTSKDKSYYGDHPHSYFGWSIVRVYPDEVRDEGQKKKAIQKRKKGKRKNSITDVFKTSQSRKLFKSI